MSSLEQRKKKVQWEEMFRVKPDILNKDFERNLQKIATRYNTDLFQLAFLLTQFFNICLYILFNNQINSHNYHQGCGSTL